MKKILALVLALAMMALCISAFADPDPAAAPAGLTADADITITGLAEGDSVYLYQVIEEDTANGGWKFTSQFAALGESTNTTYYSANINKIILNDTTFAGLTKEDVEKIAKLAKTLTAPAAQSVTGTSFTKAVNPGTYLALVAPVDTNTLYNPIIVSADYNDGGNTIDTSANLGDSTSVTKKETVTVEKETADITLDAGEVVQFTVTTTIPAFATSYTSPAFNVSDSLSTGLKFVVDNDHPFTVSSGSVGYTGAPKTDDTSFTLTFNSTNIAALTAPQAVTITYYAQITNAAPFTVNEEENDVTVTFSNNPKDDSSHGHQKDKVKEYTFSIDGQLFGTSDYTTGEIIKVGVDANGDPVEQMVTLSNGTEHSALDGAVFGLYSTQADADAGNTNYYTNAVFNGTVTTANGGLMNIKGLDEGTYYLKELSAPAGYVKDPNTHTIVIDAETTTVTVNETLEDGCAVSYDVEVLASYTVTVDTTTSSYTMTLDGPSVSTITHGDNTKEIENVKGVELPSTGGIGTTIFYILGGLLVIGAAVVLVARRKAHD